MTNPESGASDSAHNPSLDSIRTILLAPDRERLERLEAETEALREHGGQEREALLAAVAALQAEVDLLRATTAAQQSHAEQLQQELDKLRNEVQLEAETLFPRLVARISDIITLTVRGSRDKMAEALGPLMGDAIRVQIRDSRQSMIEALYPIIIETVQRAIAEFAREFQRSIDQRLRTSVSAPAWPRVMYARMRGVSRAELALRGLLPFHIEELFLIQHASGLLIEHSGLPGTKEDSDLISGMLTAIRSFARDTFGDDDESEGLDEIQYGDRRIVIQSGQYAYLAVVIAGVEPEGFRARVRGFVNELHINHTTSLRDYAGDPANMPDFKSHLADLAVDLQLGRSPREKKMSRRQRLIVAGGGIGMVLFVALACFYLQFTLALLPIAFGNTPTPNVVVVTATQPPPAATAVATPAATPTLDVTPEANNGYQSDLLDLTLSEAPPLYTGGAQ